MMYPVDPSRQKAGDLFKSEVCLVYTWDPVTKKKVNWRFCIRDSTAPYVYVAMSLEILDCHYWWEGRKEEGKLLFSTFR